jgi:hypothetical protein
MLSAAPEHIGMADRSLASFARCCGSNPPPAPHLGLIHRSYRRAGGFGPTGLHLCAWIISFAIPIPLEFRSRTSVVAQLQAIGLLGSGYGSAMPERQIIYIKQCALAETEGFEPSVPDLPVRRFSKPLVSATHPRLRIAAARRGYSEGVGRRQGALCEVFRLFARRAAHSLRRKADSLRRRFIAGSGAVASFATSG